MNNFDAINYKKMGKFIAELRKEKKMTQEELAQKIPIGRQAVSKWERGISIPDASTLIILSKIFGVTINDILNGEIIKNDDKEKNNDVLLSLYDDRNKSKKKLKYLFVVILVLFLLFLIYYFFMSYGKTKVYNISGEGENLTSVNGIFVETNENLYLTIYDIGYLDDLEYRAMELFYKDEDNKEHFIGGTTQDNLHFLDYKGYKANFDSDDLEYILSNMYIRLYFQDTTKIEIKLDVELEYTNNKLFVKKKDSITDGNNNSEQSGFQQKNTELRDKLVEVMEKDDNGDYSYTLKKGNEEIYYTYIDGFDSDSIYISTNSKNSSISFSYHSFSGRISYSKYENDDKKYSLVNINGKNNCSYGECEDIDVYKELNYYLNLIIDYEI